MNNINPIFGAVYSQMAQQKYDKMFKLKKEKSNNIRRVNSEIVNKDEGDNELDDSSSI